MKLADYLRDEGLAPSQFAERLGVPASTIIRIITGKRTPRLETIAKINEATGGKVTVHDFIEPDPARPAPEEPAHA